MRARVTAALVLPAVLVAAALVTSPEISTAASPSLDLPVQVCVHEASLTTTTSVAAEVCSSWQRQDTWRGRDSPIYTTTFVPNTTVPAVVVYAAWIRTTGTDLALYPGTKGPGPTTLDRGPEEVPLDARGHLLATFNSGFYEKSSAGGFYVNHTLYDPMLKGLATVVRYSSGKVNILTWEGGATPGANVVMARQNLTLLVQGGSPTLASQTDSLWGFTLDNDRFIWRTALGITASGDLVYAAASEQSGSSLAHVMAVLHCVRAMELDINPSWPSFDVYSGPGAADPLADVPNPFQPADRFLSVSLKDFFAVYASNSPGEAQPW